MRRVRYSVAMSLDGYIADPQGGYEIEVAVISVLLGAGLPMLPSPGATAKLTLTKHRVFKKTGTLLLNYQVKYSRSTRHEERL